MLIVVQYQDETFDMVIHYRLVELLEKGEVKGFSTPQGWVAVDAPTHPWCSTSSPASSVQLR